MKTLKFRAIIRTDFYVDVSDDVKLDSVELSPRNLVDKVKQNINGWQYSGSDIEVTLPYFEQSIPAGSNQIVIN